ncbi:MAG: hypothetical protein COS82_09720 [Zetaproteobacteria bacterium CG06_land_8_20_14_3_00_59_53]|nr:MAG: hypothetical protein AUK36_01710 [Zetaproteobacteria bacterium CG2_30_59_37]PIO88749.1 MAG: hypothetical protein COX56_11525 [Zetaproteobacteria bacterium CG23_combo_of_CG06-09_8_20_14_all_59_86]PIQ65424.1 MAG: hypothetical protein COV97_03525 [Zetaproteobacteria bacterium CG11_big_fil_rev_8_21_14_0_20_59_439]PIU69676.1 MAG: hypothetical protein COS82_09720 [Zetaproteobacteria bacterium CG06_land_8_20_14_3_00_59_53]PIU96922.1 MAG: hypothetical protein COS62_05850 [Zetaproteobacteria bac
MIVNIQQSYDGLLAGIKHQLELQNQGNAQISSGKRFTRPAEAALDYKTSLDLRRGQKGVASSQQAINTASARLNNSMSMLNSMQQILVRAQTLAVQQASGQISTNDRQGALAEIVHLQDSLFTYANQRLDGQSLFSGTATANDAFVKDVDGNIVYNGNAEDRTVAITTTQTVSSNVRGDNTAFTRMFAAMKSFENALRADNQTGIQTALGDLNTAGGSIIDIIAEVGARVRSMDLQQQLYADIGLSLDTRLTDHEGIDIASTVARLQQSSIALQASYSQVATLRSLSLVNFLK